MKRRKFIYQTSLGISGLLPVVKNIPSSAKVGGPFLATGIKIGEVTDAQAIIWVRLTADKTAVDKNEKIPEILYLDESINEWKPSSYFKEKYKQDRPDRQVKVVYPPGKNVATIGGAVPGMEGEVRVLYKSQSNEKWKSTGWTKVDPQADFTVHFQLQQLTSDSQYQIKVETRRLGTEIKGDSIIGQFTTAPVSSDASDVHFMVTTCHEYNDTDDPDGGGFKIYKHMQAMQPHFMVHTGDVIYHDQVSKTLELAHWNWQRMFGLRNGIDFYRQVPTYFMKDDHDTWMNDCFPHSKNRFMGELTFAQGVNVFKQQVPMSEKPYRTFRWGKNLQIWLVEGREYRDNNDLPDSEEKTIWGKEQMKWFKETFEASDATYRILISPTPIVGPDRKQKRDNHANSGFAHEGEVIKSFLADKKNVFIVCGDRHWQYVSKDLKTGLMEFSCGPASDEHAEGWKKEDFLPEHRYLNIVGGFLSVQVKNKNNNPQIHFSHYSVNGEKLYGESFHAFS